MTGDEFPNDEEMTNFQMTQNDSAQRREHRVLSLGFDSIGITHWSFVISFL